MVRYLWLPPKCNVCQRAQSNCLFSKVSDYFTKELSQGKCKLQMFSVMDQRGSPPSCLELIVSSYNEDHHS